jgi:hypothetical protein
MAVPVFVGLYSATAQSACSAGAQRFTCQPTGGANLVLASGPTASAISTGSALANTFPAPSGDVTGKTE